MNNPLIVHKNNILCDKCETLLVVHPKLNKIEYDINALTYVIKSQKNNAFFDKDIYIPLKNINDIKITKILKDLPITNAQNMYNNILLSSVYSPDKYYLDKEYEAENIYCMFNCKLMPNLII
jgi:hypothetical protein